MLFSLFAAACGISQRHVEERSDDAAAGSNSGSAGKGGGNSGGFPSFTGGTAYAPNVGGFGLPPMGGQAFGGAPAQACMVALVEASECGELQAGQSSGGAAQGDGGDGGQPAAATTCGGPSGSPGDGSAKRVLLDDFEDGDGVTLSVGDSGGGWYVVNDGTGQQFPTPCTLPSLIDGGRGGSAYAMRTYGRGFSSGPGAYSLVGMTFRSGAPACAEPLDASAYEGVEFWGRGSGFVRFFMGTVATNPIADHGNCAAGCYDSHGAIVLLSPDWQLFQIPFSKLAQEGWGQPAPFDRSQILTLQWTSKLDSGVTPFPSSCFDFWIDDVALYRP